MKTTEWARLALYEGLDKEATSSMMLWESAGRAIMEAELTTDQIQQLFQQIDQAKGNRTLVGKGVDAGSAVMKAYNDLKTKVANSGPIKNIDAMYDQAAEKLKQATGGDQGVMQYVQKYRDFAKKHPIAQGLIYGALISAAGISSAGLGGAAALGLFKMVDKLLQGEKFSSAAWSGAKTGAMAYGASKLGDYLKGQKAPPGADAAASAAGNVNSMTVAKGALDIFKEKVANGLVTDHNSYVRAMQDSLRDAGVENLTGMSQEAAGRSLQGLINGAVAQSAGGNFSGTSAELTQQAIKAFGGTPNPVGQFESRVVKGKTLSEAYVMALFSKVERLNNKMLSEGRLVDRAVLNEGLFDKFKSKPAADAASLDKPADDPAVFTSNRAKTAQPDTAPKNPGMLSRAGSAIKNVAGNAVGAVGKGLGNLAHAATTKVTGSTLQKAWEKAGRPTDSVEIEKILQAAGVNPEVVDTVFKANGVPVTLKPAEQPQGQTDGGQAPQPTPPTGQPSPGGQAPQPTPTTGQPSPGGQAPQPLGGAVPTPTPIDTGQKTAAGGLGGGLPDISRLNPQQRQALLQKVNARIAELSKGQQAQGNQPASKPHTGGRQRGGLSQTPNAVRQRQARAAKKAVAQPAQQGMTDLTQPTASASGGTITPTTTGYVHTANPNNPNQPKTANTPVNVNKISANKSSGLPTSDEQAKFQEKLKAAMAKQK